MKTEHNYLYQQTEFQSWVQVGLQDFKIISLFFGKMFSTKISRKFARCNKELGGFYEFNIVVIR